MKSWAKRDSSPTQLFVVAAERSTKRNAKFTTPSLCTLFHANKRILSRLDALHFSRTSRCVNFYKLAKGLQLKPELELGANEVRAFRGSRETAAPPLVGATPIVGLVFAESEMR